MKGYHWKQLAERLLAISFIARAVPGHGKPLADPARTLLVQWGKRKEVRYSLAATFDYVEWGDNRDTEALPHLNLGVLYAETLTCRCILSSIRRVSLM
jgi:hypothetical protein